MRIWNTVLPDLKYVTEKNLIDYIFPSQQPCSGDRLTDNMNLCIDSKILRSWDGGRCVLDQGPLYSHSAQIYFIDHKNVEVPYSVIT